MVLWTLIKFPNTDWRKFSDGRGIFYFNKGLFKHFPYLYNKLPNLSSKPN